MYIYIHRDRKGGGREEERLRNVMQMRYSSNILTMGYGDTFHYFGNFFRILRLFLR